MCSSLSVIVVSHCDAFQELFSGLLLKRCCVMNFCSAIPAAFWLLAAAELMLLSCFHRQRHSTLVVFVLP